MSSLHSWKIYATDIFDQTTDRIEENCNVLQSIYDPQNYGPGNSIGDIDDRVGKIQISENVQNLNVKQVFQDDKLHLLASDINGPSRKLYVVIIDNRKNFISCSKIRQLDVHVAKTFINAKGIKGELTLIQRSKFEPTWLNFSFVSAEGSLRSNFEFAKSIAGYKIHDLPPSQQFVDKNKYCESLGSVFGLKYFDHDQKFPPPGYGTQDQYLIGDLSGKLTGRNKAEKHNYIIESDSSELSGVYWDIFLPLTGKNSIVNRGFMFNQ